VLLDRAQNQRQAQPGPVLLGREEGVVHPVEHLRRDTAAVVLDRDLHRVVSRRRRNRGRAAAPERTRGHLNGAGPLHGRVDRVAQQVQQRLPQQRGVADRLRVGFVEHEVQPDPLAQDERPDEVGELHQQVVDPLRSEGSAGEARELEVLLRDLAQAAHLALDDGDVLPRLRVVASRPVERLEQQVDIQVDRGEGIPDLVHDLGGDLPDGGQLLAAEEILLQPAGGGDVPEDLDVAHVPRRGRNA